MSLEVLVFVCVLAGGIVDALRQRRLRRSIVSLLFLVAGGDWVSTDVLRQIFGGGVYVALGDLRQRGLVERLEDRSHEALAVRGGLPRVFYRANRVGNLYTRSGRRW